MVVRDKERTDGAGIITQVGVLEDDLLVEHFVTTEALALRDRQLAGDTCAAATRAHV